MNILLVDDEKLALQDLKYAVDNAIKNAHIYCFNKANEALEFAKNNKIDIAFLDINMRLVDGISMAKDLKLRWPNVNIIFCTGYDEYTKNAFDIHASGYLMKPITSEAISDELKNLRYEVDEVKPLVYVDNRYFDIYDSNNKLIGFKRQLSKVLFKILYESKERIQVDDLCKLLWKDNDDLEKSRNYLMQLFSDIRHSLEDRGINGILVKDIKGYYLNKNLIKLK